MNPLTDWLHQMTPLEWAAAFTSFACIYLTVKNKLSNWAWGIAAVLLYGWFFWIQKLYANAALNLLYYLPCCIYGWWVWAKQGPKHDDDLPVTDLSSKARTRWLIASVLLALLVGFPIARYTNDPYPYADSITTGFSIVAQYLQAKKIYENWWFWIGVDVIYGFYLFPLQHLAVSAVLYVLFTGLAIQGAREWKPLIGKEVVR